MRDETAVNTSLLQAAGVKCLPPPRPAITYVVEPGIVVRFDDEPWPTASAQERGWVRIKENT